MVVLNNQKTCRTCGKLRPVDMFSPHRRTVDGLKPSCKICRRNGGKLYNLESKLAAFNAYGGPKCVCCGETHVSMLALDHINGGGTQQRKELKMTAGGTFYRWLKRNGYPDGYQVMCANCNISKYANNGVCEHVSVSTKYNDLIESTYAN